MWLSKLKKNKRITNHWSDNVFTNIKLNVIEIIKQKLVLYILVTIHIVTLKEDFPGISEYIIVATHPKFDDVLVFWLFNSSKIYSLSSISCYPLRQNMSNTTKQIFWVCFYWSSAIQVLSNLYVVLLFPVDSFLNVLQCRTKFKIIIFYNLESSVQPTCTHKRLRGNKCSLL